MDRSSVAWSGNLCAVVTPFLVDGALDEEAFCRNLELLIEEGIDGFVVAGHTGESWAVDDEERFRLFALAIETSAGRVPVIGGVSAIRTPDAIRLARGAERCRLDGVLLTAPAYAMVNEPEIYAHVAAVSNSTKLPILLYNIPRRIGRELTPEFVARLAEIDNVVALKQSGPSFDEIARVVDLCGDKIRVFAGNSAERGTAAVAVGADGFVSSVETQALGRTAISLYRLAVEGAASEARRVQRLCSATKRFLGKYGTEPAALKVAMNHRGRPGGHCRLPVLPLTADETAAVTEFIDRIYEEINA